MRKEMNALQNEVHEGITGLKDNYVALDDKVNKGIFAKTNKSDFVELRDKVDDMEPLIAEVSGSMSVSWQQGGWVYIQEGVESRVKCPYKAITSMQGAWVGIHTGGSRIEG